MSVQRCARPTVALPPGDARGADPPATELLQERKERTGRAQSLPGYPGGGITT